MTVLRDPAADRLRDERGDRVFAIPADDALELHAPHLLTGVREAELAEGNAVLRRPTGRIHRGRGFPDRVPRIVVDVDRLDFIMADAGRIHVEPEGRSVIEIAVD